MFSDRYSEECVIYNGNRIEDSLTLASYNKFRDQNKKQQQCSSSASFSMCLFLIRPTTVTDVIVYIIEHSTDF